MSKFINAFILLIITLPNPTLFGQETERLKITENQARKIVAESLSDSTFHNVIGLKPILTKKEQAIEFAEFVLFGVYEKNNIEEQKPYNIFLINEYWFLSGTLPKGMRGGTFTIIIDSRNFRIVRLTHER